jgi:predicted component of type VI protein secretion system
MRATEIHEDGRHRRVPVMDVFRLAHTHLSKRPRRPDGPSDAPAETLDLSGLLGGSEMQKRLSQDLDRLLASVHLEANYTTGAPLDARRKRTRAIPERVAASILNHGLPDIYGLTTSDTAMDTIRMWLESALLAHEPRLNRVKLTPQSLEDDGEGIVRFNIEAEAGQDPFLVAIDMTAEIDLGAGRIRTRTGGGG